MVEPLEVGVPLQRLQSEVLVAALGGSPLPGVDRPSVLADLHLLVRQDGTVFVLDHQLAPGVVSTVEGELSKGLGDRKVRDVREVTLEEARQVAVDSGVGFLRFRQPESTAGGIRLALETCGFPDPTGPPHVLGAFIVNYDRRDGDWNPSGPPEQLAT